ncbi:MAG: LysR family transcriptional regulator [Clostridiaceae bacterium]|nr:LysR family transcriptional regulator [Clostridiaceae bacterium]
MTLKHMTVFCTVCEEMSMTKAAERLYMTQPAVSRMIGELEKHYDVRLFDRIDRQIYLTAAGKQLWKDSKNVLLSMEQLENHLQSKAVSPVLKVGCSLGIGITYIQNYLDRYYESYPDTLVRITENHSSYVEEKVAVNELDLGIIEGIVHLDTLVSTPFHKDDLAAVCAPFHALAGYSIDRSSAPLSLRDLNEAGLSLPENGTGTREHLNSEAAKNGMKLTPIWSTINYSNIFQQVLNGRAVTVLSRHLLKDMLEKGTLVELNTDFHIRRTFHIIRHKYKYLASNAQFFIKLWES